MKKKIYWFLFLIIFSISVSGQDISIDSLLSKAQLNIYQNPETSIQIGKSLLLKEKNQDKIISIYLILSKAYISQRNFDESMKYTLQAQEAIDKTKDFRKKISILISIAIQYQQMELFNKSFETLDEAYAIISEYPQNDQQKYQEIAKIFAVRGMIYKSQGNSEIALKKLLTSLENLEKAKPNPSILGNMSVVLYNIGYCYLDLEQPKKAAAYFIKSNNFARKANAKSLEAFALKGLAETYTLKAQHTEAIKLLENAENLSRNIGDLVLNEGIYKGLADNYLALNTFQKYQFFNKKYQETKFEREQSELNSINRAIDAQTEINRKNIEKLKINYLIYKSLILTSGIITIAILVYLIIQKMKKNKKYSKKIGKLIRS